MKKAILLTLTVLLVFALASCGTDKDQLAYARGYRDNPWQSAEYSLYTADIAEPDFNYEIVGLHHTGELYIELSPTEAQLSAWQQDLLASGFILANCDEYTWTAESITHTVQIAGTSLYIASKQVIQTNQS